jgi:hypothetical protein
MDDETSPRLRSRSSTARGVASDPKYPRCQETDRTPVGVVVCCDVISQGRRVALRANPGLWVVTASR